MGRTGAFAVIVIGLALASTGGVTAQADDRFCVRTSDRVEAKALQEAVVAGTVTITVVPSPWCAPLDALSDAETFGAFVGHFIGSAPTLAAMRDEPHMIPDSRAARDWLAELAADPEALAEYLAVSDTLLNFLEDELAWMEAHPPRPCFATHHETVVAWYRDAASVLRGAVSAIRRQDGERLGEAFVELKALEAKEFPDPSSLGVTCWTFPQ